MTNISQLKSRRNPALHRPYAKKVLADSVETMKDHEGALKGLSVAKPFAQALLTCPAEPGLYAFYGDEECWKALRLAGHDGRALYVEWLLRGPVFEEVHNDPDFFRRVRVEGHTVAWPNGADIDPVVLHGSAVPSWKEEQERRGRRAAG